MHPAIIIIYQLRNRQEVSQYIENPRCLFYVPDLYRLSDRMGDFIGCFSVQFDAWYKPSLSQYSNIGNISSKSITQSPFKSSSSG